MQPWEVSLDQCVLHSLFTYGQEPQEQGGLASYPQCNACCSTYLSAFSLLTQTDKNLEMWVRCQGGGRREVPSNGHGLWPRMILERSLEALGKKKKSVISREHIWNMECVRRCHIPIWGPTERQSRKWKPVLGLNSQKKNQDYYLEVNHSFTFKTAWDKGVGNICGSWLYSSSQQ